VRRRAKSLGPTKKEANCRRKRSKQRRGRPTRGQEEPPTLQLASVSLGVLVRRGPLSHQSQLTRMIRRRRNKNRAGGRALALSPISATKGYWCSSHRRKKRACKKDDGSESSPPRSSPYDARYRPGTRWVWRRWGGCEMLRVSERRERIMRGRAPPRALCAAVGRAGQVCALKSSIATGRTLVDTKRNLLGRGGWVYLHGGHAGNKVSCGTWTYASIWPSPDCACTRYVHADPHNRHSVRPCLPSPATYGALRSREGYSGYPQFDTSTE
jgi:hypothetical protein